MKKLLFLLSIFTVLISCSKDETPPPDPIVKYTITLSAGEGGTVSTTGGEYEAGQTVSVTATPQGEYLFKDWSDGNTNATRTITVSSNSTLTANFEKKKYPLTINIEGEGDVLEEIVNSGRSTDYDSGTTVKLTAVPAEDGWEFSGWTGAIESDDNPVNLLVSQAQSVTAVFNDDLKQSIIGKWDFETSSTSGKGNQTANGNDCTILSIIFNTDMTFKMYVGNIVLFGDFSISNNSIELKIEDKSIGLISQISVEGSSLSATFNLNGYCVSVNVAQKVEDFDDVKTYMPDDTFEQIMIDAGIDDILDNYVLTENLKTIRLFRHWRNSTYIEFLDGNTYFRSFEENERYVSSNGRNDINGLALYSVNPGNTYKFIYNVAGLEDFENLERFQMFVNKINEVDFSKNTNLVFLALAYGTSDFEIKLPNPMPEELSVWIGDFKWDSTTLDLSGDLFKANKQLWVYNLAPIEGYSTFIENFQGLSNIQANEINFMGQHLTSLDMNLLNKDVVSLGLEGNLFEEIDLNGLDNLEELNVSNNPLKRIDLSKLNKLNRLDINRTQIDELDLSNQGILEILSAKANPNLFCIKLNSEQLDFLNEQFILNEEESDLYNYYYYVNNELTNSWITDKQASFNIDCQNPIYLDENGITIKAYDWAEVGDKGRIDGVEYTVVDEATLRQMVANDEDVTKVVTTKVADMNSLFDSKEDFNQNIGSWDTSNVANMSRVFRNSYSFNQDISNWNTSSVTNMSEMFASRTTTKRTPFNKDISNWNVNKVTNMSFMFTYSDFNKDIGDWNVSNVTDMSYMFSGSSFNQEIGSWNVSNVTDMRAMFQGVSSACGCGDIIEFNQDIGSWDTSNVTNMRFMFNNSSFNQDIGSWDVSNVTDMSMMFSNSPFDKDISSWNVSNVTSMVGMFRLATAFNHDIDSWDVSNVTDMTSMFSFSSFDNDISSWNVSKVTMMDYMFNGATSFNQDLSSWCVTNFTSEPNGFNTGATAWTLPKPVWGTCPE
jgi:surface protein